MGRQIVIHQLGDNTYFMSEDVQKFIRERSKFEVDNSYSKYLAENYGVNVNTCKGNYAEEIRRKTELFETCKRNVIYDLHIDKFQSDLIMSGLKSLKGVRGDDPNTSMEIDSVINKLKRIINDK